MEHLTGAGEVKFYPFVMKRWEQQLVFRYWNGQPWWLRLWFAMRTITRKRY